MAGRFNINLARECQNGPLKPIGLAAGKPGVAEDLRFFAVGGTAEAGAIPRVGLLVHASDDLVMATGFLIRCPGHDDRRWGMAFVLHQAAMPEEPFDLLIQSQFGHDPTADRVTGLHFAHDIIVSVIYPTGGTLCAGSVGTYGSFSGADTKVERVKVTGGSTVLEDTSPYYNAQGFWSSVFTLAAGTSYSVEAVGDANPSGQAGAFSVVDC